MGQDNSRQKEMIPNPYFEANPRGEEEDKFGQALLTDGDRMGELIPSIFAWMPMEAMRERVKYMEEVTNELAAKEKEARQQDAQRKKATDHKLDVPPWPTAQSDQLLFSDQAARRKDTKGTPPGKKFLDNYNEDLQLNQAKKAQDTLKQPTG